MPLKYKLEEVLIENSPVSRHVLIRYLNRFNVLEYKCALCGNIGEWQGQLLTLQIDHINGIRNDNRKENLRWLCPNCHSQTETFCGRNQTKKEPITFTDEEAILALQKTSNINQATKLLGCSAGGANWIRVANIKEKNNIVQLEPVKEKIFCQICGRELSTPGSKTCQECLHKLSRTCEWPTREELKLLIRTTPFTTIGKKYNVTDNAVRKWCDHYNLPKKVKDIKKISDEDWINI